MEEAVIVDEEGPKIRPEMMKSERIYHCIYDGKILLFFLDEQGFLNCYEIDDADLVERIKESKDVEKVLTEYAEKLPDHI